MLQCQELNNKTHLSSISINELTFLSETADCNYSVKLLAMSNEADPDESCITEILTEKYTSYNQRFKIFGLGGVIENFCTLIVAPEDFNTIYIPGGYFRIIITTMADEVYRQDLYIFPASDWIDYNKLHDRLMYSMLPKSRTTTITGDEFFHAVGDGSYKVEITGYRDMRLENEDFYIFGKEDFVHDIGSYIITLIPRYGVARVDVSAREVLKRFNTTPHYYVVRAYINNELRKETTYVITAYRGLHNFAFRNIYGAIETLRAASVTRTDFVDAEIMTAGYKEYRIIKGIPDIYNVKTGAIQTVEEFRMWRCLLRGKYTWYKINGEYYPIVITEIEENPISMGNDAEQNFTFKFRMANKTDNYKL